MTSEVARSAPFRHLGPYEHAGATWHKTCHGPGLERHRGVSMVNHDFTVRIESRVRVKDGRHEGDYTIVDATETDAGRRLISAECPLARALLGHCADNQVQVRRPAGCGPMAIVSVDVP